MKPHFKMVRARDLKPGMWTVGFAAYPAKRSVMLTEVQVFESGLWLSVSTEAPKRLHRSLGALSSYWLVEVRP